MVYLLVSAISQKKCVPHDWKTNRLADPTVPPGLSAEHDISEGLICLPKHLALEATEQEPLDLHLHPPLADEDHKDEEAAEHVAAVDKDKENVEDSRRLAIVLPGHEQYRN